jgi:hypothetical protein
MDKLPYEIIEKILRETTYTDLLNFCILRGRIAVCAYKILHPIFEIMYGSNPVYNIFRNKPDVLLSSPKISNLIIAQGHKFRKDYNNDELAVCCCNDEPIIMDKICLTMYDDEEYFASNLYMNPYGYIKLLLAYGKEQFIKLVNANISFNYSEHNDILQLCNDDATEKIFDHLTFMYKIYKLGYYPKIYYNYYKHNGDSELTLKFRILISQKGIDNAKSLMID